MCSGMRLSNKGRSLSLRCAHQRVALGRCKGGAGVVGLAYAQSVSIPSESTQSQLLWWPGEEDEKGPGIQGQFGDFRIRDYRLSDFRPIQTFSRTLSP